MTTAKVFVVCNAAGEVRVTRRRPSLKWDEVAWPLIITIPAGWGVIYDTAIELTMPEPTITLPRVGIPEGRTP